MKKKHPIRQRKKGDKISLDVKIPLPPTMGSQEGDEINFTIAAYPDDWKKLTRFLPDEDDMKHLGKLFYINVINTVFEEKIKHIDTRADFMNSSRKFVAAAIAIVTYWIAKSENEWSSYFSELISELNKDEIIDKRTRKYNENKIAYRLWENRFKKRRRKNGILFPKDSRTFRRTYITGNSNMDAAKDIFNKLGTNSTIEDVENFLYIKGSLHSII